MNKKIFSVAILIAIFTSVALAHGDYTHVMGTVTKITDTEVTVETTDKQVTVVKIASTTTFLKSGAAATLKDLKVGDRVVIHAKPVGTDLVAHEVRFGKMPATGAAH
jgi:Domain of unknown function (DUF5666)